MKKGTRITLSVVGCLVALCLMIVVALQVITIQSVTNRLLHRYVPQFVRADASVERLHLRTLSVFPNVEVELVQPVVTSPALDTLLAADTLRVKISPCALAIGRIHLRDVLLSHPRLYLAERNGQYNFDILLPDEDDTDTTATQPFAFEWDTVRLTDGAIYIHSDSLQVDNLTIDSLQIASGGIYQDSTLSAQLNMGLRVADTQLRLTDVVAQISGSQIDTLAARAWLSVPHVENLLALLPDTLRQLTIRDNTLSGGICLAASLGARSSSPVSFGARSSSPALAFIPNFVQAARVQLRIDSLYAGHPRRAVSLDNLTLRAEAAYDGQLVDSTFVRIDTLLFNSGRSMLQANAEGRYRGGREWLNLNLRSNLYLKELVQLVGMEKRIRTRGRLRADVATDFYLDDLLQRKVYDIHSSSTLRGDDIFFAIPEARTRFFIDSLRAEMKTNRVHVSRRTGKREEVLLNTQVAFRRMTVKYRRQTEATVERTMMRVYADDLKPKTTPTLHASITLDGVNAQQFDTIRLMARRLRVSAGMHPNKEARFVPTTSARVAMDSVMLANPRNATLLDSLRINVSTTPRYRRFHYDTLTHTRTPIADSEQQVVALDSLLRLVGTVMQDSLPMETYLKRFRTTGKVYMRRLGVRHRGDHLRPTVSRVDLTLNDDTVRLNSFRLRVGRSAVSLKGEVKHLRRYLLRGKTLDANLTLRSRRLDLNQLANALSQQQRRAERMDSIAALQNMDMLSDTLRTDQLAADTLMADSLVNQLLVLPHNLNVSFNATVDTIMFSQMRLNDFTGQVRLTNQTLSATNISTSTEVGRMNMSVRYTCKDTAQAMAAASVTMDSVQVGELVAALPELDSVMPMLRSFDGSIGLEAAAQLRLKSDMSIDLPSVNAGAWLRGEDLVLLDGETFSEIAKLLMFSKKTRNRIDSLSVEVLVRNNQVEIFPFMLAMDKYRAGVGGKQQLDGSFNYHISLLKPLKLGLDVYGQDFDHIRFKLVKPKYQTASSKIGKGGTLLRKEDANIIPELQKSIRAYIQEVQRNDVILQDSRRYRRQ